MKEANCELASRGIEVLLMFEEGVKEEEVMIMIMIMIMIIFIEDKV